MVIEYKCNIINNPDRTISKYVRTASNSLKINFKKSPVAPKTMTLVQNFSKIGIHYIHSSQIRIYLYQLD